MQEHYHHWLQQHPDGRMDKRSFGEMVGQVGQAPPAGQGFPGLTTDQQKRMQKNVFRIYDTNQVAGGGQATPRMAISTSRSSWSSSVCSVGGSQRMCWGRFSVCLMSMEMVRWWSKSTIDILRSNQPC